MQTYSNVASPCDDSALQRPMSILVADTNPQEHLLITMAAQLFDYPLAIEFASNGAELLQHLASIEQATDLPDVIVLELRMAGFDGWRTLTELEQHPVFCNIPAVVFTSSTSLEDEAQAYELGAVGFQTKPRTFDGMERFLIKLTNFVACGNGFKPQSNMDLILTFVNADLDADVEDQLLAEGIDLTHRFARTQVDTAQVNTAQVDEQIDLEEVDSVSVTTEDATQP